MKNKALPIILDGDPGHDDAIAWTLAASAAELDILAVTTVGGNAPVDKTTVNALQIWTLLGQKQRIARGRSKPLFCDLISAPSVHGESGLDGPKLPQPSIVLEKMPAIELMKEVIMASDEKVTVVATGPLTNIADLLLTSPESATKIAQIVFMGGGIQHGNWTAAAEFNILVDPEAAHIVMNSGIPLVMCGLDVTEKALIKPEDINNIKKINNKVAQIVAEWLEYFFRFHRSLGYSGAPLHDAVAVLYLIAPKLLQSKDLFVDVELYGDYCRGATVADYHAATKREANCKVILDINRKEFVNLLLKALESYGD